MSSNNVVTRKWYFNPVYWLLFVVALPIAWVLITQTPDKRPPVYGYTMGLSLYHDVLHKLQERLEKMEDGNPYVPTSMILMEGQEVEIIHRYSNGGVGNYFDNLYKVKIGDKELYLWSPGLYIFDSQGKRVPYYEK